ncbi:hypothetical protein [Curtobacterium sp. csp3]|uniref:hypothetical protein n=1 Tax=Curtobacterium sp. csp3 TaxID=2588937 RepID=UPI00159B2902|nr:hypothetical protein [Curtobacterium sp. csp3]QKS13884.1 hypothetical protein HUN60_12725 [Curtobacterium sp. csp3]
MPSTTAPSTAFTTGLVAGLACRSDHSASAVTASAIIAIPVIGDDGPPRGDRPGEELDDERDQGHRGDEAHEVAGAADALDRAAVRDVPTDAERGERHVEHESGQHLEPEGDDEQDAEGVAGRADDLHEVPAERQVEPESDEADRGREPAQGDPRVLTPEHAEGAEPDEGQQGQRQDAVPLDAVALSEQAQAGEHHEGREGGPRPGGADHRVHGRLPEREEQDRGRQGLAEPPARREPDPGGEVPARERTPAHRPVRHPSILSHLVESPPRASRSVDMAGRRYLG